jgi:hypothetical protein
MSTPNSNLKKENIKMGKDTNTYIVSLSASAIKKCKDENKKMKLRESDFKASLPLSLELLEMKKIAAESFTIDNEKEKSTLIINVTFRKKYFEYKVKDNLIVRKTKRGIRVVQCKTQKGKCIKDMPLQLRKYLYKNGFDYNKIHYVEYKRSGAKAKEGSHLFIDEKYYKQMISYSRMDIDIPEDKEKKYPCDLTAMKAYESLVGSSIEYTIDINPDEILIVNDINDHLFTTPASVVYWDFEENKIKVKYEENYIMHNDIFDGESLLDESLFPKDDKGNMPGMQLLRQRYLKTCAFNCSIQKYYKSNGITEVINAYGTKQKADKIKLIITPNSLKLIKIRAFINSECTEKEAYEYWINHLSESIDNPCQFGVVKTEHHSKYGNGNYNKVSYQMISSLPLSFTAVRNLLETDFRYIKSLKNHPAAFRMHIKNYKITCSGDFMHGLLSVSDDFSRTDIYRGFLDDTIQAYRKKMKKGKISVKGDYSTICSMPYELLQWSHGVRPEGSLINPNEVYCKRYIPGQKIALFRSPHICASNVIVKENKHIDLIDKWFNLTDNIIVISPWESDILQRANDADMDSDTFLCVIDKTIVSSAEEVQDYPTPINGIKDTGKATWYNEPDSLAELDEKISNNLIGSIVNLSAVFNSYYWAEYFETGNKNSDLYDNVLILAILSGIEIDKAKKAYSIDSEAILKKLKENIEYGKALVNQYDYKDKEDIFNKQNEIESLRAALSKDRKNETKIQIQISEKIHELKELKERTKEIDRPIRPYWMQFVQNKKVAFVWDKDIKCPMNYLINILESKESSLAIRADHNIKRKSLEEFFNYEGTNKNSPSGESIKRIIKALLEYCENKKNIQRDIKRDRNLDKQKFYEIESNTIKKLKKFNITEDKLIAVLYRIYAESVEKVYYVNKEMKKKKVKKYPELYKEKLAIMSILFKGYPKLFKKCLINYANVRTDLIQDITGDVDIWGINYKITSKNTLEN